VVRSGCGAPQRKKGKGQAKGGGGGPSNKAAAAGSSSGEASTSRGESSRPSTLPSASAGLRSTVDDAVLPVLPSAEATQQTEPQPQPAGGGKKEKERQRKERQRQRKMDEAWEVLQVAIEAMLDARCVNPLWLMCIGRFPGEVVVSMCG
jgi:hypothetical protein